MNFKEQITSDIQTVFVNSLEFAERKSFDGKLITLIEDENELLKRSMKKGQIDSDFFKNQKLLFVPESELGGIKPEVNTTVMYEKRNYLITDVNYEQGIYSIAMEAHKG